MFAKTIQEKLWKQKHVSIQNQMITKKGNKNGFFNVGGHPFVLKEKGWCEGTLLKD
jgi:hypothetical protein